MERNIFDATLKQLIGYNGPDFVFNKTEAPISPGTIVLFKLGNLTDDIPAYVHARHEYSGKWKYDLIFALLEGDSWRLTRIYNVESGFIKYVPKETYNNEFWQAYKKEHGFC
jgi:hypothetical protein